MPKLLQPKTLKKQKSLDELHEEITKDLDVFEYPEYNNPDFVPETYEEWLEEMEHEMSIMTPEEKEESEKRTQKTLKMLKQINPKRFKEIQERFEKQWVFKNMM